MQLINNMLKPLLLLVCFGTALSHGDAVNSESLTTPLVTTKQGTLKGITQTTIFGRSFYSFLGVRYAKSPVDELRFMPPVPPERWEGVYDATKDGPACPQPLLRPVSEDCLFINVHTPRLPRKGHNRKYPVILYIHPGSFTTLTGNSAYAGPQYLLDKDIVLVTFNYRLATLGFISTGDELAPGNNGLKDHVQAMRWVKENIAAFGGDPDSVLLAGYSVGGVSASLHMVSPMSRGLFHKILIMSGGSYGNFIPLTHQLDLAKKQARIVGCPDNTTSEIFNCLKTISAERLGDTLEEFRVFGTDPQFICQPAIESDFGQERFLTEDPQISIQCGKVAQVPVMTGITARELIFLAADVVGNDTLLETMNNNWNEIAPYAFYYKPDSPNSDHISTELKKFYFNGEPINSNSLEPLGKLYSDLLAGYAIDRGATLLSRVLSHVNKPVYYYAFSYKGRYSNFNPPEGNTKYVVHFDDMMYVFWNSLQFPMFNRTDPEAKAVKKLTTLWVNFAYSGNPVPRPTAELDWVSWNRYTEKTKKYLDFGKQLVMKRNFYSERYEKLESCFPYLTLPAKYLESDTSNARVKMFVYMCTTLPCIFLFFVNFCCTIYLP